MTGEDIEYYWDEDGVRHESGPSFKDYPGMWRIISPIEICKACKKADFDEDDNLTLCDAYGKIPKKYLKAESYDCPCFENLNNGWYQLIKDKVEEGQKNRK